MGGEKDGKNNGLNIYFHRDWKLCLGNFGAYDQRMACQGDRGSGDGNGLLAVIFPVRKRKEVAP